MSKIHCKAILIMEQDATDTVEVILERLGFDFSSPVNISDRSNIEHPYIINLTAKQIPIKESVQIENEFHKAINEAFSISNSCYNRQGGRLHEPILSDDSNTVTCDHCDLTVTKGKGKKDE